MFEALGTILASSGAGSIIGGVFGLLNRKEERRQKEADQRFQLESMRLGGSIAVDVQDAKSFTESQKTVSKLGGAIKSLYRPLMTSALLYMTYRIMISLDAVTGGVESLTPELAAQLYRDIVLNIISLTATAVNWWFAARGMSKK